LKVCGFHDYSKANILVKTPLEQKLIQNLQNVTSTQRQNAKNIMTSRTNCENKMACFGACGRKREKPFLKQTQILTVEAPQASSSAAAAAGHL